LRGNAYGILQILFNNHIVFIQVTFLGVNKRNTMARRLSPTQCSTIRRAAARGGYITNPITKRRVYATTSTGKALIQTCRFVSKQVGKRRPMKFRKNKPMIKKFKGDRPSPGESATLFSEGTRRRGNDGNMWIIRVSKSGVHRWVRV
jgi:hypothetical protein